MRQASDEQRETRGLAARLRQRRGEIEQATLLRVRAVSALPRGGGPEYAEGLRGAVSAAIGYGLEGIERGEQGTRPVPDALIAQARLAARSGVGLDTVLRRYFAGHALLEDFVVAEAERAEALGPAALKRLLRSQAALVDRLLAAVSEAYAEETKHRRQGAERRRAERVERLLAGEPLDTTELGYGFGGWHVGLLACGPGSAEVPVRLAEPLDCRLLSVHREEETIWAWLAFRGRPEPSEIEEAAPRELPAGTALAIGEPGEGIAGWRRSHCQARAALPVALRGAQRVVRYARVAVVASALQDELLCASLRERYLLPLSVERGGREALGKTLRAYFAADRQTSSTAAALGVDRHTVTKRIRAIEERIGQRLRECTLELELALRLEEFS